MNPKKYGYASLYSVGMGSYKHIETATGRYIAGKYCRAVEVGIGRNTVAAEMLAQAGVLMRCTDVKDLEHPAHLIFAKDDVFEPDITLYQGADVIFAIRPGIEMIPPLVALARKIDCDLLVRHLGFEVYGDGGEKIDCGIVLHRYWKRSEPVKEG
jgi:uncharacterized protein